MAETSLLIGLLLLAALAFANGSNDVSKGVATLVGSGVTQLRRAILWGTVWTVAGGLLGLFFSTAMVATFTHGILSENLILTETQSVILAWAVILGAMGWVSVSSWKGLPVSTTHAITGAICGAGLAAWGSGGIEWASLGQKVLLPLAASPFLALGLALIVHPLIRRTLTRWPGHCVCLLPLRKARLAVEQSGRVSFMTPDPEWVTVVDAPACDAPQVLSLRVGPDTFHWITSGLTSLARGLNDGPKMVALLAGLTLIHGGNTSTWMAAAFVVVALGMGLGGYWAGRRVTEVLAVKITRMDHLEGFTANLSTALLVTAAARMGLPVSTTHVSSSAIIGMGLLKGPGRLHWKTVGEIFLAWAVTLPVSALLSASVYLAISALGG